MSLFSGHGKTKNIFRKRAEHALSICEVAIAFFSSFPVVVINSLLEFFPLLPIHSDELPKTFLNVFYTFQYLIA